VCERTEFVEKNIYFQMLHYGFTSNVIVSSSNALPSHNETADMTEHVNFAVIINILPA
jgi:hypothetical protein